MNAYYQKANRTVTVANTRPLDITVGDKLISAICAIVSALTSDVAIIIGKISFSAIFFFAFFGVAGSIESGSISFLAGITICLGISLFEFVLLKSLFKKSANNEKEAK
jgi:hypothetical protein